MYVRRNWKFSIPPPFINTSSTGASWENLDNAAWGSHVYFELVRAHRTRRTVPGGEAGRGRVADSSVGGSTSSEALGTAGLHASQLPIALSKFATPDWRSLGADPRQAAESPAQHRYPVWWTGDMVGIGPSVQAMVDAGVHGLKPYVHSDCGGDWYDTAAPRAGGAMLRWLGHCVFGTILRFHSFGGDHRPFKYGQHVTDRIRFYLKLRYRLMPSLMGGVAQASSTGFPIAARADLLWPSHAQAQLKRPVPLAQ